MLQSIRQNPWENIGLFEPPTKFETFTANEVYQQRSFHFGNVYQKCKH